MIDVFLRKNSNLSIIENCSCCDRILYLRVDAKEIAKYDNLEKKLLLIYIIRIFTTFKLEIYIRIDVFL